MRALPISILAAGLFLTAGCGLHIHFTQSTSPLYWAVENRTQAQEGRIRAASQDQQLPYFLADGLLVNDDLIRRLNGRFRDASNGAPDLSADQSAFLNGMIEDNGQALADALTHPAAWDKSFAAQDAFARSDKPPAYHAFNDPAKRLRFIVYLNARLKADTARAQAMADSGRISPDQSQDLQQNLNDVQNKALADYLANGALDLTADQIFQLRRMLADAYEPLNRPQSPPTYLGGAFQAGVGFSGGGYPAPGGPSYGGGYQSIGQPYYNPPKGGQPAPTATPTPKPGNPSAFERNRMNHYPGSHQAGGASQPRPSPPAPTDTPVPVPTDTPVPEPSNDQPRQGHDQGQNKDRGNHFGQDHSPAWNDHSNFNRSGSAGQEPSPADDGFKGHRKDDSTKAAKGPKDKNKHSEAAKAGKKDRGDSGDATPTPED